MDERVFWQVKLHIEESDTGATLFVTDDAARAVQLAADGHAVLGILTEENKQESFAGVKYLTEDFDAEDTVYLERVYRRYAGLPWHILETDRLLVRESTPEDADAFYEIYKPEEVHRFMRDLAVCREEQIRYMEQYRENMYGFYDFGIWTLVLKETGQVIGRVGFALREGFEEPEIGFVIGKPWQRMGLAKEACQAILVYGREELGFDAVQALVEPENEASVGLLQELGFTADGKENSYLRYLKLYR